MTAPTSSKPTFAFCVQSGELAAREALAQVFQGLEHMALDTEELGTVELVLAEALNNVVEHAYPEQAGPIDITCSAQGDGLHFRIEDQGNAMPDGQVPLGQMNDIDVDMMDLPEGGFGWFLIRDLAKDITYNRIGTLNQLTLRIAITRAS